MMQGLDKGLGNTEARVQNSRLHSSGLRGFSLGIRG